MLSKAAKIDRRPGETEPAAGAGSAT